MLIRISKGEIFFDEFNSGVLDNKWTLIPNDSLRYSVDELPNYLKMFHGTPDFMLLLDEPDTKYVMDIKNNYIPLSGAVQAGIIVFRELNNSLEILEYYDVSKDESFVYEYMRLSRNGQIYTVYAKNVITDPWEMLASVQYEGAGKIGLIVKGPNVSGASEFEVDYVRIYKSQDFQIVNLPLNYKVEVYRQDGSIVDARRVTDEYNGVSFSFDDIPPVNYRIKIFNSNDILIHEAGSVEVCGGDVYLYGPSLQINIDGENLYQDKDFMLGYFKTGIVDFELTVTNPYPVLFTNVGISAMQYGTNQGYKYVKFLDEVDGEYKDLVVLGDMNENDSKVVTARIFRSGEMLDLEYNPYKFNIRLTTD
jgi:hypothetical protein